MLSLPPVLSYHRLSFRTPRDAYEWTLALRACLDAPDGGAPPQSFIARPVVWAPLASGGSDDPALVFVSDGALIAARGAGLHAPTGGLVTVAELPDGLSLLVGAASDLQAYHGAAAS